MFTKARRRSFVDDELACKRFRVRGEEVPNVARGILEQNKKKPPPLYIGEWQELQAMRLLQEFRLQYRTRQELSKRKSQRRARAKSEHEDRTPNSSAVPTQTRGLRNAGRMSLVDQLQVRSLGASLEIVHRIAHNREMHILPLNPLDDMLDGLPRDPSSVVLEAAESSCQHNERSIHTDETRNRRRNSSKQKSKTRWKSRHSHVEQMRALYGLQNDGAENRQEDASSRAQAFHQEAASATQLPQCQSQAQGMRMQVPYPMPMQAPYPMPFHVMPVPMAMPMQAPMSQGMIPMPMSMSMPPQFMSMQAHAPVFVPPHTNSTQAAALTDPESENRINNMTGLSWASQTAPAIDDAAELHTDIDPDELL